MPTNLDIEKVKKEEYVFKKNDELITPVDSTSIETNEIDSVLPTVSVSKKPNATEPFMEIISTVVEPTTNNEIDRNLDEIVKVASPVATTESVEMKIFERKDLEKTVTLQAASELNVAVTTEDGSGSGAHDEDVTVFSTNEIDSRRDKEDLSLSNGGTLKGSILETFDSFEATSDDNDEDYSTEITKTPRPTVYFSKQRTLPSSTLLHGFISNPGYPSFYIGKPGDCKWKLQLNEGQSIALTILDLHLRSKKINFYRPSLPFIDCLSVCSRRILQGLFGDYRRAGT